MCRIIQKKNIKRKISQLIAYRFEKKAVQNASVIYSVSDGINNNLRAYHSLPKDKPMYAIPYGVEPSDFKISINKIDHKKIMIRYIGAVWPDAYPVLKAFLNSISITEKEIPLFVEFYGTSYAGEGLAKEQTKQWVDMFSMNNYMIEEPKRVSYKKAVELTLTADIVILFGGMQPYYAASKLMGLIASGQPFIAFLHEDSFPAEFLKSLNYKYIITYSQKDLPDSKIGELSVKLKQLINNKDNFVNFDLSDPLIQKHTALGMTREFVKPLSRFC